MTTDKNAEKTEKSSEKADDIEMIIEPESEKDTKKPGKDTNAKAKKNVEIFLIKDTAVSECSNEARILYDKSRYGMLLDDGRVQFTLIEAYYLLDKDKANVLFGKKALGKRDFLKRCMRLEKNFWTRYAVYADFRNRGYIIKTALKFGADFRVYDKGVKPGEDHAKWIVYPVKETDILTWYEFAAKNRVAHSTKKRLLIGVVDEENSVTYYEIRWTRP